MLTLTFPSSRITGWPSFHAECAQLFGFPDFYGANMNAWIDCLSDLRDDSGLCAIRLADDEQLRLRIPDFADFQERLPEICSTLLEGTAFVNQRAARPGETPPLLLQLE